ncbi:MAG: hypothetical protein WDN69_11130 [Aliidongia sp.]
MQDSGTAILHAAAYAHALLLAQAADYFSVPVEQVTTHGGMAVTQDGRQTGYGELVGRPVAASAGRARHRPQGPPPAIGRSGNRCRGSISPAR